MKRYSKEIVVAANDLDALNHVNNVRYLEWVQEVSGEHWHALSRPEWDESYVWVVRSHHIRYFRPAVAGDRLRLETYVSSARGARSDRVVEICNAGDGTRVAICQTEWCLLDKSAFRPVRMPEAMAEQLQG